MAEEKDDKAKEEEEKAQADDASDEEAEEETTDDAPKAADEKAGEGDDGEKAEDDEAQADDPSSDDEAEAAEKAEPAHEPASAPTMEGPESVPWSGPEPATVASPYSHHGDEILAEMADVPFWFKPLVLLVGLLVAGGAGYLVTLAPGFLLKALLGLVALAGAGVLLGGLLGSEELHSKAIFVLRRYVFSKDHKVIGIQFLITAMVMGVLGGLLALLVRWQLAWPGSEIPFYGKVSDEGYVMLFTMHASVMIFLVIIPVLVGAFGNFVVPLQVGARDMAFPTLNMLSYWVMPIAICVFLTSFFVEGGAAGAGWTAYPPLSGIATGDGQTLWIIGVILVGTSSVMGAVNYLTTIIRMRAPGLSLFRLPLFTWSILITSILSLLATPVLTSAVGMVLLDRVAGTNFFVPHNGGQVLLYQHLFWFYSHPAVYIMILPAMGMVSDMLPVFSRKPLFGYKPMVYSICGIAGLGFIVWGHHMFQSGMNPVMGTTFMISTMLIALPSAIKTFNWMGTLWKGRIQFTPPALFAISFVAMFIIGGLSGIFMAATPVDIHIHDTYFIVAHIHYVVFAGTLMAVFGAVYFWFPKMFGRMMNDFWGKVHFWTTLVFLNGTFFLMHVIGLAGHPRRIATIMEYPSMVHLQWMNQVMTVSLILLGTVQIIFFANFFYSLFFGKKAGPNPWKACSLEWTCTSPPWFENYKSVPTVYHGPYEFSRPDLEIDYVPQSRDIEKVKVLAEN